MEVPDPVWETTKSIFIACVCRWWTFPIQIPHCEAAVGEDKEAADGEDEKAAVGEDDGAADDENDEAAVGDDNEAAVGEDDEIAVGEDERKSIWSLLWRFLTSVWGTTKSIFMACVCW